MSGPRRRSAPRLLVALVAAAVLAGTALTGAPASAGAARPGAGTDPQVKAAQAGFGEASADEAAAIAAVTRIRARKAQLDADLGALDGRIASAAAVTDAAAARARELGARYDGVSQALDSAVGQLRASRAAFRDTVASLYRDGGAVVAYSALVATASDFRDVYLGQRYLRGVSDVRQADVARYRDARDALDRQRAALADEKAAADAARAESQAEQASLTALRTQQAQARAEVAQQEAAEAAVVAQARARKASYAAQLAALKAESDRLAAMLRARGAGGTAPGKLRFPANGPITSTFGPRVHPIFGDTRVHTGIDIGAAYGSPVWAAAPGVVVSAGAQSGYGNAVVIDHGGGLATLSGHLSRIGVTAGQRVGTGQVIGWVGSTGYSTGPHLHFEVRVNGTPVDPLRYL